ncbi:MAG TPA: DUF2270 domain-containing protein [Candidatus Cryosericum sp.]|nr:DUF2270 domain-containing protein [Candidatus Cryosericum sp.]
MAQDPDGKDCPAFEDYPLTRQEYISAMVHFYRGEMHRSQIWRQRLDTTTNWAVVTTAAVVSFTFGDPTHPHIILLLANLLIGIFLIHEARRFRYFAVYRARVRMLEENFFLPLLTRRLISPMSGWSEMVATDLDQPKFKTTFFEAIGFRLSRNYLWIFFILILAWFVKLFIHPTQAASFRTIYDRMAVGTLAPWVVLLACITFLAGICTATVVSWRRGAMDVDEIKGLEKDLAHWRL